MSVLVETLDKKATESIEDVSASTCVSASTDAHVDTLLKAVNPFMSMCNRCITYAACIYVSCSTFNALIVFMAVQRSRQINLII